MTVGRTIFAFVIAVSVAFLPTAPGMSAQPASTEMSLVAAMGDCCPNQTKSCDKAMDKCMSMTTCTLNSLNLLVASVSHLLFPLMTAHVMSAFENDALHSRTDGPPLRPPQA